MDNFLSFKGVGTAIITPFNDDNDKSINYVKLKELIEFQIRSNVDSIVVCGTTGESSTLTLQEKKALIDFTVKTVGKRCFVIAGTGSNYTKYATELSVYAESVGCDGILVVTPYYNKCNQEGLYLHYKEIADNINIPIILYNVPTRTCVNLEPKTVIKLSKINNIIGLKQANSDLSQTIEILNNVDSNFYIYSGNDDLTLPILSLGGMGVISVMSNFLPKQMKLLTDSFFNNDLETAKITQLKYYDLMKALFKDINPIPVKECMNILEFNVGKTRLPLCDTSENNKEYFKNLLKSYNLI